MTNKEIWKPVDGYEDYYEVSSLGRVRSLDRVSSNGKRRWGRILSPSKDTNGYWQITLWDSANKKTFKVARLVAIAFVSRDGSGDTVNHINGDKLDNRPSNLEWVSRKENVRHSIRTGLRRTKLNDMQVRIIRRTRDTSLLQREVGEIFGVSEDYAGKVMRREAMMIERDDALLTAMEESK